MPVHKEQPGLCAGISHRSQATQEEGALSANHNGEHAAFQGMDHRSSCREHHVYKASRRDDARKRVTLRSLKSEGDVTQVSNGMAGTAQGINQASGAEHAWSTSLT
jgi:hypothetical protein